MKQKPQRIGYDWPADFIRLCNPIFVGVKGRVFVAYSKPKRVRKYYEKRRPEPVDENTSNHEHIEFFDGGSLEGIQKNHALAESLRLIWQHKLSRQFPNWRFMLFVVNEYELQTAEDSSSDKARVTNHNVTTTLRLWTIKSSTDDKFGTAYHIQDLSCDKAIWPCQWIYHIDVGALDLDLVCDVMKVARRRRLTLGEVKKIFLEKTIRKKC